MADKIIPLKILSEEKERLSLNSFIIKKVGRKAFKKYIQTGIINTVQKRNQSNGENWFSQEIKLIVPDQLIEQKVNYLQKRILFENSELLIINKWPEIEVVEQCEVSINSLLFFTNLYLESKGEECFAVHRLDLNTSGAVIFAKNLSAARYISELLKKREVEKYYLALVKGIYPEDERLEGKITIKNKRQVTAISRIKIQKVFPRLQVSLLEIKILTGRFHQIRLQLSARTHPVVLDKQHGDFKFNKYFRQQFKLQRQFLHCYRISFPFLQTTVSVEAPLEKDLVRCLEKLKDREKVSLI